MSRLKDILTFDHDTGIINLKYKKVSDLAVSPNYDNLRHLGKITRYWFLYSGSGIACRRFWGKNYFGVADDNKKIKIYKMTKAENQQMDKFDFGVGLSITSVSGLIILSVVSNWFKPIMCVIIVAASVKFIQK